MSPLEGLNGLNGLNGLGSLKDHHHRAFKGAEINLRTEVSASHAPPIRTIPELIDYNARVNPEALFCYQALKSTDASGSPDAAPSVAEVNMRQLRDAVWHCSQRLRQELGLDDDESRPTGKSAPVGLLMDSDLGLWIHLCALLALGVPVRSHNKRCRRRDKFLS